MYELAREGKVVEREARAVTIFSLELVDIAPSDYPEVTFRTVCSTGTYVRTLGDDLARALGGRAHLTALRRVRNGALRVEDAVSVDEVIAAADSGTVGDLVIEASKALDDLAVISVDDSIAFRVRNGRPLEVEDFEAWAVEGIIRITDKDERLLAVYRRAEHQFLPEVVLG